jgi:hypothetical protein
MVAGYGKSQGSAAAMVNSVAAAVRMRTAQLMSYLLAMSLMG